MAVELKIMSSAWHHLLRPCASGWCCLHGGNGQVSTHHHTPRGPEVLQSWQKTGPSDTRTLWSNRESIGSYFPHPPNYPSVRLSVPSSCLLTFLPILVGFVFFFSCLPPGLAVCLSVCMPVWLSCIFIRDRRTWAAWVSPGKAGLLVFFASCSVL